ncbi:MAG: hypothetical protein EKK62_03235 [Acidimicrobiia bacterium]|nr:MAG: hypothetical protein EKK62_03235 [Acidimicrobiia bacterium]
MQERKEYETLINRVLRTSRVYPGNTRESFAPLRGRNCAPFPSPVECPRPGLEEDELPPDASKPELIPVDRGAEEGDPGPATGDEGVAVDPEVESGGGDGLVLGPRLEGAAIEAGEAIEGVCEEGGAVRDGLAGIEGPGLGQDASLG